MQDTCKYQILYETCGFSYTGLFLETLYPRSCLQARQTRLARTIMNIKNNSEAYTTEKKKRKEISPICLPRFSMLIAFCVMRID